MPAREPVWWYGTDRQFVGTLLRPIAAAFGAITTRRMGQPPAYRASVPVICVGNFTAGGTGKTPLTAFLAAHLITQGAAPAILTRGYGGRLTGPHWVDTSKDLAVDVGDEPLQHAHAAPTLVARDRVAGARAIETDLRAFTHILMDDGLQNPALAKALRIALVDAQRGVGNGAVIPSGPLRAPLGAQFAHTDDIERPAALKAFAGPVFDGAIAPTGKTSWLAAAPIVAFAGIGAPDKFFRMLHDLGATLVEKTAYPDHHPLTEAEAKHLLARAAATGASLVTTEKDRARLSGLSGYRGDLRSATRAVPIRMTVTDPAFLRLIDEASANP
jgi:tetraacyldisaccharide 4'-kinase